MCHFAGPKYRCVDYFNDVDADAVPVPHTGVVLNEAQFHALMARIEKAGVPFIVAPHVRFAGQPGEQWTAFFKDPSGNNLEFKVSGAAIVPCASVRATGGQHSRPHARTRARLLPRFPYPRFPTRRRPRRR